MFPKRMLIRLEVAIGASFLACALISGLARAERSWPSWVTMPGGSGNEEFGRSVAIDGDAAIIGAPSDDSDGQPYRGSAYIYRWNGSGWEIEATLTASDGGVGDSFGVFVALSGDTAVVGAPYADVDGSPDRGAAYVFVRSGGVWIQQAKLVAGDGAPGDYFGSSVAIDADAILIGAPFDDVGEVADAGSVHVFGRSDGVWAEQQILFAPSPSNIGDLFGWSVAMDGDAAAVGWIGREVNDHHDQGAAVILVRNGGQWEAAQEIVATDGAADDIFGFSVAIHGDRVLVGSYLDDVGANADQGSAYIFERDQGVWQQQAQLTGTEPAPGTRFGISVALSNRTALIGAFFETSGGHIQQGAAYSFELEANIWRPRARFVQFNGDNFDNFGNAVALSGDHALVAAYLDDVDVQMNQGSACFFSRVGAVWVGTFQEFQVVNSLAIENNTAVGARSGTRVVVFEHDGARWNEQDVLIPSPDASPLFGDSIAISGDTVVVGDTLAQNEFPRPAGAAYVFVRNGGTWSQQAKLVADDQSPGDFFGGQVAISGESIVVGAMSADVGPNINQGALYTFVRNGTEWTQEAKLVDSTGVIAAGLGARLSISNQTIVAGLANSGARVFARSGGIWNLEVAWPGHVASIAVSGDLAIAGMYDGSAAVYRRTNSVWNLDSTLRSPNASGDSYGSEVGICDGVVIVGASTLELPELPLIGAAYLSSEGSNGWGDQFNLRPQMVPGGLFGTRVAIGQHTAGVVSHPALLLMEIATGDLEHVRNQSDGSSYWTLLDAVSAASPGQLISASESAWRAIGALDVSDLDLVSDGDVRYPRLSSLRLRGTSTVAATDSSGAEVFGQLEVAAASNATLFADSFLLGAGGSLSVANGAELTLVCPSIKLQGDTMLATDARLEIPNALVTLAGSLQTAPGAILRASTLTNRGAATLAGGTLEIPQTKNHGSLSVTAPTHVTGSIDSRFGAAIRLSNTLSVDGVVQGEGALVGSFCQECTPRLNAGSVLLGRSATVHMPLNGMIESASFVAEIDSPQLFGMAQSALRLTGESGELEAMSDPIDMSVRYPIGTLRIGPAGAHVTIRDHHDNDGRGQDDCEAVYVGMLIIEPGAMLSSSCSKIYYNAIVNQGTLEDSGGSQLYCPSDLTADAWVDDSDFVVFASAYDLLDCADPAMPDGCPADINRDGLVEDSDFVDFAGAYDRLVCP